MCASSAFAYFHKISKSASTWRRRSWKRMTWPENHSWKSDRVVTTIARDPNNARSDVTCKKWPGRISFNEYGMRLDFRDPIFRNRRKLQTGHDKHLVRNKMDIINYAIKNWYWKLYYKFNRHALIWFRCYKYLYVKISKKETRENVLFLFWF